MAAADQTGVLNPNYKHGQVGTVLYQVWADMRSRCYNKQHAWWGDYGGRGINVDLRWDKFVAFAADMGPHPGKGWTLDRIDNNDGYRPGNCRWATMKQQNNNQRPSKTHKLTKEVANQIRQEYVKGSRRPHPGNSVQLAEKYGVSQSIITRIGNMEVWV